MRLDYENDTATEPADGSAVCEVLGSTNQCRTGSVPVDFHFDRVELVQCVDAAGDLTACPQAVGIGDAYPLCEGEWREKSALSTSEHRDRDEGEPPVLRPHR